jgi:hypothetical protein
MRRDVEERLIAKQRDAASSIAGIQGQDKHDIEILPQIFALRPVSHSVG